MEIQACGMCRAEQLHNAVYTGPVRAGRFGKLTVEPHRVLECNRCRAQRLVGPATERISYADDSYRETYDGGADPAHYFTLHDAEQNARFAKVGLERLRNRVVADFGCGAGAFLDAARGVAERTIGVEPSKSYQAHLVSRGHEVFSSASEVAPDSVDIAVSFQVIEHVDDALGYLEQIAASLRPQGKLFLSTPNRDDILLQLGAREYDRFFYRTVHLWYFDVGSLRSAAERAGFDQVQVTCEHRYDISNAICWLRDSRPTGTGTLSVFDARVNNAWRAFLEEKMLGDTLWLTAERRP